MESTKIVALVTSVNMDDYLLYTLSQNRALFKNYYVLIHTDDSVSENLCYDYNAIPIKFDKFFVENKSIFNKSGGIRYAQNIIHEKHSQEWILLIDTDIVVDKKISSLELQTLDKNNLYGMKRLDTYTYQNFIDQKYIEYKNPINKKTKEHMAVGYFQMYFDKNKMYSKQSYNAATCDCYFASLFDHNIFLDNMYAIHIGEERSHWNGRKKERLNWPL